MKVARIFTLLCKTWLGFHLYSRTTQLYIDMSRSTNLQSNYSEVTEIMTSDRRSDGRRRVGIGGGMIGEERRNEG
jgi:hypothetical protein